MEVRKTIIIGSGPAGYTAGIYAGRAELKPLIIAGPEPGGQLMTTTEVENWPSAIDGIMGPDLIANLKKQAEKFDAEVIADTVVEVDFSQTPFIVKTVDNEYQTESVIVATGASAIWLNIPGEEKLRGKGVSACATCDGFFFRDKKVVLVGGGDAAIEEAVFLTRFASEVIMLVRRGEFRASKPMQKRALENPKITILWNTNATELIGDDKLERVKILNNKTNEEMEMAVDGFFVAIGHRPNTDIFENILELDIKKYIKHQVNSMQTNVEGVFVCGDVSDHIYQQAITAAGSGCMAALDTERYLANKE